MMAPTVVHLPNGQIFKVLPSSEGYEFQCEEPGQDPLPIPTGWMAAIHRKVDTDGRPEPSVAFEGEVDDASSIAPTRSLPFSSPSLVYDTISIHEPATSPKNTFKPHVSPSRQVALMLWVSLYWYFQQPEPAPFLYKRTAELTPMLAKPKGDWIIRIERDGVFRDKNLIPPLERMGLISCYDTSVGSGRDDEWGWDHMFVSRRAFWQIPTGVFLFKLEPSRPLQSQPPSSPLQWPTVRSKKSDLDDGPEDEWLALPAGSSPGMAVDVPGTRVPTEITIAPTHPLSPNPTSSYLPTYYPPPPLQYIMTSNVRHPRRQKPPRMGEQFYCRYIPYVKKYLSFRVTSISQDPVFYIGPVGKGDLGNEHVNLCRLSDKELLKRWFSKERVSEFWGEWDDEFLFNASRSRNSFPVIGSWDGVPFGYFEIYWVKEDPLGYHMGSDAQDFDRGLHVLVGEEWARGRVSMWLSSLVHWCWQADNRTMNIYLEPRVDNISFIDLLQDLGFAKERQIALPHKQSWLCRLRRDDWNGPPSRM
ncbi:acyl-CoA N-acyltransferase [Astrocystis sublimbata]|nr:acyl-CoA N-acyltransferase [Astrocystis sublimbata]